MIFMLTDKFCKFMLGWWREEEGGRREGGETEEGEGWRRAEGGRRDGGGRRVEGGWCFCVVVAVYFKNK